MIPVTACFPQVTVHDEWCLHFYVIFASVNFSPIFDKSIFYEHTFWQEEWEARCFVMEHKQVHFFANFAVVTFFCFFEHYEIIVKFFLAGKCNAVDTCEHCVVFVVFPVCARLCCDFEGLETFCIAKVWACAHIYVVALGIKTDLGVFWQIANVLYLIFFTFTFHKCNCFVTWQN